MIERRATVVAPARPRHVAIVMDGSLRWAAAAGLPAIAGQHAGLRALCETALAASERGIEMLTAYVFADDDWRREAADVEGLNELVGMFVLHEAAALRAANVRVQAIGRISDLPDATRQALDTLTRATAGCDGLRLNLALNYGARRELCDAVRALARDVRTGILGPSEIDDDSLSQYLYTAGMPDPDLLIRTGGELRVSNFLLYQIAYAELWSTRTLWPDFDAAGLDRALDDYASRQRRFGS